MVHVICYDVSDDARRAKIANVLLDFGTRVQWSVFECLLDQELLAQLKTRLEDLELDPEDRIRIYPLCQRCTTQVLITGPGEISTDPDLYIV